VARQKYEDSLDPEFVRQDHCERSRLHRKTHATVTDKSSNISAKHLNSSNSTHLDIKNIPAVGICNACGELLTQGMMGVDNLERYLKVQDIKPVSEKLIEFEVIFCGFPS